MEDSSFDFFWRILVARERVARTEIIAVVRITRVRIQVRKRAGLRDLKEFAVDSLGLSNCRSSLVL